jgi:serine/threonine protein kinase
MPTPPPDPNGRPSSRKREVGVSDLVPKAGSGISSRDGTSRPAPESLSEVFAKTGSSCQITLGSDLIQSGGPPPAQDDDAPTVITQKNGAPQPSGSSVTRMQAMGQQPLVAGRRLGHYELIEAVGAGGMAAVLRARDLELGRIVALKILPPESARDSESVVRFKQEARAAALLDHENVARVYSCGEDQGLYFIAFEFVEGINMRVMIDRRGTLPARECIGYMIQVAAGLAHAAERGVVHRDIKPSNIVITPDGRAKIVDMGLARQLDAPGHGGVTQSGVTLGTFDYISPEQALDPRRADVRSDIYSLGCAFYHALTGRPPVPEGTAAKKLHAHQYTEPLDPRQLNAAIPDEVVIVLGRMMAKDPAKRYQTPQELIAYLKGTAERLQLSSDAIERDSVVRAVVQQSALPQPPRLRWGFLVGAASVALAVAALAMSGGSSVPKATAPPWALVDKGGPRPVLPDPGTDPFVPPPTGPVEEEGGVRTAEQLAARLADAAPDGPTRVQLAPGVEIDLTKYPAPLLFKGKELELTGSVRTPAVVRVRAGSAEFSASPATPRPGVFVLPAATDVSVSGVRFEVEKPLDGDEKGTAGVVGLLFPEAARVQVSDCSFAAPRGVGAVRIGRAKPGRDRAKVRFERCVFAAHSFGLWLPDWCDATVADCGFGPHEAAVQIGESRTPNPAADAGPAQGVSVRLDRSSFLFDLDSAAVRNVAPGPASGPPAVRVTAGHCVFAPVGSPGSFLSGRLLGRAAVVRCGGSRTDTRFDGEVMGDRARRNAYYGVAALGLTVGGEPRFLTFEECKTEELPVADAAAVQLAQRPWAEPDPGKLVGTRDPWRAFRLKLTDAALFTTAEEKVIGAQFSNPNELVRWRAYPDQIGGFPPPPKTSSAEPRQLVWFPELPREEQPPPKDTHHDLAYLLTLARPGDTILIRHNGLLPLEKTVDLEKARNGAGEFRLTFRADRGFAPVLAAPGNDKLDQTLFRLVNGEVAFEGIQFVLKPARPKNAQVVAAVTVIGGRACSFKDCVFTLAEEDDSRAAAVHLADPDKVMAMEPGSRPEPLLRFERCVLRGKGRGVWSPVSRAVKVEVEQSLTALDGPLFLAEPGGKANLGARSSLRLARVTAFVGGPLVEMRGARVGEMRASGLVPLEVHADECLFAAVPNAGRPLVGLDGVDATEAKAVLEWKVQTANRYANFDDKAAVMVLRPDGDGGALKELTWDQWITFAGEKDGRPVGKVVFQKPPGGIHDLIAARPLDAVVKAIDFPDVAGARVADAGAKVEALPSPAADRE